MRQWMMLRLLLLLVLAASGACQGFLFPDDDTPTKPPSAPATTDPAPPATTVPGDGHPTQPEEDHPSQPEEDAEDYDYGPTVDPELEGGELEVEERFFFGKRTSAAIGRKLGQAASSLLNTLSGSQEKPPVLPPPPRPDHGSSSPFDPRYPGPGGGYPDPGAGYPGFRGGSRYPSISGQGGGQGYQEVPGSVGQHGYSPYEDTASHSRTQGYQDYDAGSSRSGPSHHGDPQDYSGFSDPSQSLSGPIHHGDPEDYPDFDGAPSHTGSTGRVAQNYPGDTIYEGEDRYGERQSFENPLDPDYGDIQRTRGYQPGHRKGPGYGFPGYKPGQPPATSYGDYEPQPAFARQVQHEFPVNRVGVIICRGVPKWKKKACRRARRRQQRTGLGGQTGGGQVVTTTTTTTPAPVSCPSVPDKETMAIAQERCCGLQQKGDLYGFNNCCQTYGFCPLCKVDSEKLAKEECCRILHEGDNLGFRQCCSRYGTCPECGPAPVEGCLFQGQLYPVGSLMERNAHKCLFIYCRNNGAGPEPVIETEPTLSGCCTQPNDTRLFLPGTVQPIDPCTNRVCENSEWVTKPSERAASLISPCPEGWLDLGRSCVFIWRELMSFNNATIACGKLLGSLFLPQNGAQHKHVINAFRGMEDRDQSRELGGWVNVQAQDNKWQTLRGDTLTFAPWEKGHPDNKRRTNCAGLTVTERSEGWKDYMCDNREHMLYPICEVPKPDCGEVRHGCGPYPGGAMIEPGAVASEVSNECERFVCNEHSFVVRDVNKQCCYHKEWNGRAFGRKRGWYTGLFKPGGFQLYDGMLCECTNGVGECTQFF